MYSDNSKIVLIDFLLSRPATVCLCPYFPNTKLKVSTSVYVIQHPNEENRSLRTVPILFNCLQDGKCCVIRGRRFSETRYRFVLQIYRFVKPALVHFVRSVLTLTKTNKFISKPRPLNSDMMVVDRSMPKKKSHVKFQLFIITTAILDLKE